MVFLFFKFFFTNIFVLTLLVLEICTSDSEKSEFNCNTVDNFAGGYLRCNLNISFKTPELYALCIKSGKSYTVGVSIRQNSWLSVGMLNKLSGSVNCVSNSQMSVSVDFMDELSSFTNIRQERLFQSYNNKSTYEYKLSTVFPFIKKIYIDKNKLIVYKIASTYSRETKILLQFREENGSWPGVALFKVPLFDTTNQEFIRVPLVNLDGINYTLHTGICRKTDQGDCMRIDDNPPLLCLESGNNLDSFFNDLGEVLDALNFKHEKLIVLESDEITRDQLKKILASFRNSSYRPIVVTNQIILDWKIKRFYHILRNALNSSCIPEKSLPYDQLLYMLQLLEVQERVLDEEELLSYDPFSGFKIHYTVFQRYVWSEYYIRNNETTWNDLKMSITFRFDDLTFSPITMQVVKLPKYSIFKGKFESNLRLNCSGSRQFNMTSSNPNLQISSTNSTKTSHKYQMSTTVDLEIFKNDSPIYINCMFSEGKISDWIWSLLKDEGLGKLSYSAEVNQFICQGMETAKLTFRQWNCNNRFQCLIIAERCLHDYLDVQINEYSYMEKECMLSLIELAGKFSICTDISANVGKCVSLHPAEKGLVQCYDYPYQPIDASLAFESHYMYFRGFDNILYYEKEMKEPPPLEATLKLSSFGSSAFYVNGEYDFKCEAHSFFFDDGLQWFFQLENGTAFRAISTVPEVEFSFEEQNSTNAAVVMQILLKNKSLKEIICSAPVFGKGTWENVSFQLNVFDSIPPKIVSLENEVQFVEGEKNQIIPCHANGLPTPKITWTTLNPKIELPLKVIEGNTLVFPIYNSTFSGEYECTATNIAGKAKKRIKVIDKRETYYTIILVPTVTLAAFLVLLTLFSYIVNKKMKRYNEMKDIVNLLNGNKASTENPDQTTVDPLQLPFDEKYEITKNTFIIDRNKLLGKGEFGEVYRGLLDGVDRAVAFKTVRLNCGMAPLKALVTELKIMMYIGSHENLVKLLGAYRQEITSGILYVAMEFCECGSLESFLRKNKFLFLECPILNPNNEFSDTQRLIPLDDQPIYSIESLLKWALQISTAMEYLAEKKVVHSDLATRNVLLTTKGDAKVTDFGLSRRTYNYTEYVKTAKDPLPWRWLALESLKTNTFSSQSDVWSFGITLWEMFSLGDIPYPGLAPTPEFVQHLENGLRNSKPKYASDDIYDLMVRCWNENPAERPTFFSLRILLGYAVFNGATHIYVPPESSFETTLQLAMTNGYLQI